MFPIDIVSERDKSGVGIVGNVEIALTECEELARVDSANVMGSAARVVFGVCKKVTAFDRDRPLSRVDRSAPGHVTEEKRVSNVGWHPKVGNVDPAVEAARHADQMTGAECADVVRADHGAVLSEAPSEVGVRDIEVTDIATD
jgi:hypothetical protein